MKNLILGAIYALIIGCLAFVAWIIFSFVYSQKDSCDRHLALAIEKEKNEYIRAKALEIFNNPLLRQLIIDERGSFGQPYANEFKIKNFNFDFDYLNLESNFIRLYFEFSEQVGSKEQHKLHLIYLGEGRRHAIIRIDDGFDLKGKYQNLTDKPYQSIPELITESAVVVCSS